MAQQAASRRDRIAWWSLPRRYPVTAGLFLANIVVFSLQYALGGVTDPEVQLRLGALAPARVWSEGELYRLVMAMFLHHGLLHIGLNLFALVQLVLLTEHLYGRGRALLLYLLCGVGAALCTALMAPPWVGASVGASGAIMGIAGVLLGSSWYGRDPWRAVLRKLLGRRLLYGVLLTFGLGLALELVLPIVDNWGHFGGFVTGLVLAVPNRATPAARSAKVSLAGVGAAAMTAIVAVGFGWAVRDGGEMLVDYDGEVASIMERRAARYGGGLRSAMFLVEAVDAWNAAGEPDRGLRAMRRVLAETDDPDVFALVSVELDRRGHERASLEALELWRDAMPDDADALNALAWGLVTRETEAARKPKRAERLSRKSLALLGDAGDPEARSRRAAFLDTLAETLIQQDRLSEALPLQQEAVALATKDRLGIRSELEERLARIERGLGPR